MPEHRIKNVVIENARLLFRNFEGREGKYNRKGDRSFSIALPDDKAAELNAEGWNIKELPPREDGDRPQKYVTVAVRYPEQGSRGTAPKVVLITSRGRNDLDEDTVEFVDSADIRSVDVEIRPYEWSVNGNTGVKAYLKELYIEIEESYLTRKYQDVPELGRGLSRSALTTGKNDDDDVWDVDPIEDDQLAIGA